MWDFPGSENLSEMRYVYVLYISYTKTAPGNLSFLPVLILVYRVQSILARGDFSLKHSRNHIILHGHVFYIQNCTKMNIDVLSSEMNLQ